MIEPPAIVETDEQIAAVIHMVIPRDQMPAEMPSAIQEIMAALSAQDVHPTGPLFAHHLRMSLETFDFEVGFPVNKPVLPTGRVKPGALPSATVIRSIYHGPYEGLHGAWAEFGKRVEAELSQEIRARGLAPGETLWESYLSGPESSPDPSTWRTELNRPVVKKNA